MDFNEQTKVLSDMDSQAKGTLGGYVTNLGLLIVGVIVIGVMAWSGNTLLALKQESSDTRTDVQVIKEQLKYIDKYDIKFENYNVEINNLKDEIRDLKSELRKYND